MDSRLTEVDPTPPSLPEDLALARGHLAQACDDILSIPDAALEAPWHWPDRGELDARSGIYIALQQMEEGVARAMQAVPVGRPSLPPLAAVLGAAAQARWDLHGLLIPLTDSLLDAPPGDDAWTLRQTLGHVTSVQRIYPWVSAWWLTRRDEPEFLDHIPDDALADLPQEDADGAGSLSDIRRRFDALLEIGTDMWQAAPPEDLRVRARWSGSPVDVGFRIGRWSPHIAEHTIQVEKTLTMLGHPISEVDRLARLMCRGFGRLEATVWARPSDALSVACGEIAAATSEAARLTADVRAAVA